MNNVAICWVLESGPLRLGPQLGNVSFYLKLLLLWLQFVMLLAHLHDAIHHWSGDRPAASNRPICTFDGFVTELS